MKANELMVGDWVYDTILEGNTKVGLLCEGGIRGDFHIRVREEETFEPIPLTPKILENNGFKDIDKGENCDGFDIYWRNENDGYSINMQDLHLHYVHQLQHALKLCGINKEIVL